MKKNRRVVFLLCTFKNGCGKFHICIHLNGMDRAISQPHQCWEMWGGDHQATLLRHHPTLLPATLHPHLSLPALHFRSSSRGPSPPQPLQLLSGISARDWMVTKGPRNPAFVECMVSLEEFNSPSQHSPDSVGHISSKHLPSQVVDYSYLSLLLGPSLDYINFLKSITYFSAWDINSCSININWKLDM